MKVPPRSKHFGSQPDRGEANPRTNDRRISGSGHLGLQMLLEDKSNHFSNDFMPTEETENAEPRLVGHNPEGTIHPTPIPARKLPVKKQSSNKNYSIDTVSVSTLGAGSAMPHGFDHEVPTGDKVNKNVSFDDADNFQPWVIDLCPNNPHPLLEFPPLYWLVKRNPRLLEMIKAYYQCRWHLSYPLQRRVNFLSHSLTLGEVLLMAPVILIVLSGILSTFVFPDAALSGHAARLPLILALATGCHNSILTLLLGLPFERALWYHKALGRIAFALGILHTLVAHREALQKAFFGFLVFDQMNASGTGLILLIGGMVVTSFQPVRRRCFELFYYIHCVFVTGCVVCAFFHSGVLVPIAASILWGGDLLCRKVIMACCLYPRRARLKVISDTVVQVIFPKTRAFSYNSLQSVSIAIPSLSLFEWHPFSIASSPREKSVVILIRVVSENSWTGALHRLAKEFNEVDILVEGPMGSPSIDVFSDRYQSFLMIAGGIGVTPCQSMLNTLVWDYSKGIRDVQKIRFVFSDRDSVAIEKNECVRRSSHFMPDVEDLDLQSLASASMLFQDDRSMGVASTLLSLVGPSLRTDEEMEEISLFEPRKASKKKESHTKKALTDGESTFRQAWKNPDVGEFLDMQVFLTGSNNQDNPALKNLPFVKFGRPNIEQQFADARQEALDSGLNRIAVVCCAPARLAAVVKVACVKYSDSEMSFDCHMEYQD